MKYKVISGDQYTSGLTFSFQVEEALKDGWIPQGGIFLSDKDATYHQAFIKKEEGNV